MSFVWSSYRWPGDWCLTHKKKKKKRHQILLTTLNYFKSQYSLLLQYEILEELVKYMISLNANDLNNTHILIGSLDCLLNVSGCLTSLSHDWLSNLLDCLSLGFELSSGLRLSKLPYLSISSLFLLTSQPVKGNRVEKPVPDLCSYLGGY